MSKDNAAGSIIIRSVTGKRIDLARFDSKDVETEAVFHGLSKECRFAKQIFDFYSVAQHSIHVQELLREESLHVQRFALLHDASEAYIGDVSRQLKHSPLMKGYRILEETVQESIENALIPVVDHVLLDEVECLRIKAADDLMAIFERVVVRDRLTWADPAAEVSRAYADGYVSYVREEHVHAILPQLAEIADGFSCWTHSLAREKFTAAYYNLFGF